MSLALPQAGLHVVVHGGARPKTACPGLVKEFSFFALAVPYPEVGCEKCKVLVALLFTMGVLRECH